MPRKKEGDTGKKLYRGPLGQLGAVDRSHEVNLNCAGVAWRHDREIR